MISHFKNGLVERGSTLPIKKLRNEETGGGDNLVYRQKIIAEIVQVNMTKTRVFQLRSSLLKHIGMCIICIFIQLHSTR